MKRSLSLLLALVLAVSLTACGSSEPPTGTVTGDAYENPAAGFGFALDSGWSFATDELLDMTEASMKEKGTGYDPGVQVADMMAFRDDRTASVTVHYTAMTAAERIAFSTIDEEDYMDQALQQKDIMISTYARSGILVTSVEKVKVNFCGEERYALLTVGTSDGEDRYSLQLVCLDLGSYYMMLTVTSFGEDTTGELLELFYSLD